MVLACIPFWWAECSHVIMPSCKAGWEMQSKWVSSERKGDLASPQLHLHVQLRAENLHNAGYTYFFLLVCCQYFFKPRVIGWGMHPWYSYLSSSQAHKALLW